MYAHHMSTMIQIRNVPDDVHRRIKARAALAGMSMSEYILRELERLLERPTRQELLERIDRLTEVEVDETAAEALHQERSRR